MASENTSERDMPASGGFAVDLTNHLRHDPPSRNVRSHAHGAGSLGHATARSPRRGVCVRVVTRLPARRKYLEKLVRQLPGLKHCETQLADAEQDVLAVPASGGHAGGETRLVVLDTRLHFGQLLDVVSGYVRAHPTHHMVVISERLPAWQEGEIVEAGAKAFIPDCFRDDAILSALGLVVAGQRFLPYGVRPPVPVDLADFNDMSSYPEEPVNCVPDPPLTRAEIRVCGALTSGRAHKQIAADLGVAVGVIGIHINHIKHKFRIRSLARLRLLLQRLHDMDLSAFEGALRGEPVNLDWLFDLMTPEHASKGAELFRKGDPAGKLYLIVKGRVDLPVIGKIMGPGTYFGEVGLLTPEQVRTHTAVCATDVELRTLDVAQVRRFYQLKPLFATQMLVLITQRLREDIARLEGRQP